MASGPIPETMSGKRAGNQRCRNLDSQAALEDNAGRFANPDILPSESAKKRNVNLMVTGISRFRTAKPARWPKSNLAPDSTRTARSTQKEDAQRANYRALMAP
jgi:hypothetical protein